MALVEVTDLRKQYGGLTAVDGVSFEIREGEVFSLLGPNGAGKSTSIGMLTALIEPSGGDARIDGLSVRGRAGLRSMVLLLGFGAAVFLLSAAASRLRGSTAA
jgi:ABC-type multidrug transport system ATPase subunit